MKRITLSVLIALLALTLVGVPWVNAQEDTGPRTVTDFMGQPVTINAPPQRVVGMSASINEMLFAIGVTPAGVTDGMDYPPAAANLPTFGSGYQPDLEALAALEPDLIIGNGQLNMQIMDKLQAIAPTLMILTLTPDDVVKNIRTLGQATWHDTEAEYLAQSYDGFLTAMGKIGASQAEHPSILIIVGTLDVPNYGKSETYLGAMAKILGATNIADGNADQGPFPGYTQLSTETVLAADPDFVFTITQGSPTPMPEAMKDDPIWSSLTAFQDGHVMELDVHLFLESPGPRFVDAMLQLYDILYGGGM